MSIQDDICNVHVISTMVINTFQNNVPPSVYSGCSMVSLVSCILQMPSKAASLVLYPFLSLVTVPDGNITNVQLSEQVHFSAASKCPVQLAGLTAVGAVRLPSWTPFAESRHTAPPRPFIIITYINI